MSGDKVTKNTLVLIVTETVRRLISFVVAVLVARALSVDDFGRFGLAMALAGIFEVAANFGLNPLLTRKVAAARAEGEAQLGNILSLKIVFGVAAAFLMMLLAGGLGYERSTFTAVVVLACMLPALGLEGTGVSLFDGYQQMSFSALVTLVKAFFLLVCVALVAWLKLGLAGVLAAYLAGSWLTAFFSLALMGRMAKGLRLRPRFSTLLPLLKEAVPFLLVGVVWMVAFRVDMVILERLKGVESAGLYRSGYAFFEILLAIPVLTTRALYPALSQGMGQGREEWRRLLVSALHIYLLVALPVALGCALVGGRFVPLFYGQRYAAGGQVVALLGGFLWLWFGTMTFGWALTAADRLKTVLAGNLLAMSVNIVSNFILIPRYDFYGAALSTVISESCLLLFFSWQVQRYFGGLSRRAVPWRAVPAAVALAVVVWWWRQAPLALVVAGGALVYVAGIWLSGALNKTEREQLRSLLARKDG